MITEGRSIALLWRLSCAAALVVIAACMLSDERGSGSAAPTGEDGIPARVVMCDDSLEAGPVVFDHRSHHAAREADGQAIECGVCHHEIDDPGSPAYSACSDCHPNHNEAGIGDPPSL